MGDFNYHIAQENIDPDQCMKAIADIKSSWEILGEHDEMRKELQGNHAYFGFSEPEMALDFHPSYKKKVTKCSKIMKAAPNPKTELVFWVEHVLEFGGEHLRPQHLDMPW